SSDLMVRQEYPTPSYDDMSFDSPSGEERPQTDMNSFMNSIPTPAAMPPMMQQSQMYQPSYGQGYQPQGYGQQMPDYGAQPGAQYQGMQQGQPMMPQMEFGQQYQGMPQQPAMQQPVPQQAQPAAPEKPATPPTVERDDLGVPAFLRRSKK
ncbi:MAG: hypothetical protein PHY12_04370, partial [Eubacteriales bacterium]|nr:hypothetical protein [Eubacteriales bacterium]